MKLVKLMPCYQIRKNDKNMIKDWIHRINQEELLGKKSSSFLSDPTQINK